MEMRGTIISSCTLNFALTGGLSKTITARREVKRSPERVRKAHTIFAASTKLGMFGPTIKFLPQKLKNCRV